MPVVLVFFLLVASSAGVGGAGESASGAHWAYNAPQRPVLPEVQDRDWPVNEIDYFVLQRLEQADLVPTGPADKVTLIRRVTLDLTGLPPTRQQVQAFLDDRSDEAYATVVERLLGSEQYGERMAAWWLDLARYADTHGYEGDGPRNIWLYRDWVIDAFHRGLPFDRFTVEQLAGDLLPGATDLQRIATGFHRNTPFCYEAGTDLEQFRVESVVDRVNTTMTVWMGTTMGCAQCHDHKYDPFSQRDYYQLYAFFNNSAEADASSGVIATTSPLARDAVARHSVRLAELREELAAESPELAAEQRRWEQQQVDEKQWQVISPMSYRSLHGADLRVLKDSSVLVGGKNPEHDVYELTFSLPELALGARGIGAMGIEVLKHESLPHGGPGRYDGNGNFALSNLKVEYATSDQPDRWRPVHFSNAVASYEEGGDRVLGVLDDEDLTNWCTNQSAAHAIFITDQAYVVPAGSILRIVMQHNSQWDFHGVGRFRWWVATGQIPDDQSPLEAVAVLEVPPEARTPQQRTVLAEYYRVIAPCLEPVRQEIAELETQMVTASTMVMVERDEPRATHIFHKGSFLDPGEMVEPGVPAAWHAWPENAPFNRLGLARWLMETDNPLVARVTMNRIWALIFGQGIVETSEDLGSQSALPSHPMLLDYLATEFVAAGWDLQEMQRQIVTSATYRQSSAITPRRLEQDPGNRLFSRGPVFRLDAEMIRDNALAVSGLLTQQLGGPGVYPYQPPGVFEQIHSFTTAWDTSTDGQQYRRALYTWWKRTAPYPSMLTFDAPRRGVCVERRPRTNTPLQALVTLNDPVYVQCAAALGRRMVMEVEGDAHRRAAFGFELCVARQPTRGELDQLVELYRDNLAIYQRDTEAAANLIGENSAPGGDLAEHAAWSVVGNVLLNLDETLTKY